MGSYHSFDSISKYKFVEEMSQLYIDLRRSYARLKLVQGVKMSEIAKLGGHLQMGVTSSYQIAERCGFLHWKDNLKYYKT